MKTEDWPIPPGKTQRAQASDFRSLQHAQVVVAFLPRLAAGGG